ncbi:MAG TPA: AEC family transporter [Methylibium sp.]|uniref:AEC family transporter n=1 Tax=Methylibium sp. TaxID=2067992 RepID=UPI002DBC2BA2|nr:AEC family transporter [Methylibium sp.]HEU4458251.1 AEC family transporter [Methylibium sp.]
MQSILAVTLPFFALVLCGWLAGRLRVLPEAAIPGLNSFVLYFALPCMLFQFGARTPVSTLLDPTMLAVWAATALLIVGVSLALLHALRVELKDGAFAALVAAFPNTGFMGVPLMTALLGAQAAGPMMLTMLVDMFMTTSVCLVLAQWQASGHLPFGRRVLDALRGPVRNPQPWAIALGAVFSATGAALPAPAARVVELLAGAATPVALFTIGAVLWRAGLHVHTRTPLGEVLPIALIKLLLHPLAVLAIGVAAISAGAPLSSFHLTVLMLAAALPSASNVSLLAERFGADNGRVARIILASTALAFVSFSALAWLAGARPH